MIDSTNWKHFGNALKLKYAKIDVSYLLKTAGLRAGKLNSEMFRDTYILYNKNGERENMREGPLQQIKHHMPSDLFSSCYFSLYCYLLLFVFFLSILSITLSSSYFYCYYSFPGIINEVYITGSSWIQFSFISGSGQSLRALSFIRKIRSDQIS